MPQQRLRVQHVDAAIRWQYGYRRVRVQRPRMDDEQLERQQTLQARHHARVDGRCDAPATDVVSECRRANGYGHVENALNLAALRAAVAALHTNGDQ